MVPIKRRGPVEVFGRSFLAYDFPASKKLLEANPKSLLLDSFPVYMPSIEGFSLPLFHFPHNGFDHYAYVVANWYKPETLLLFDEHNEGYNEQTDPNDIHCGNWVTHLLSDSIIQKVIWFHGKDGLRYVETKVKSGEPVLEESTSLEDIVKNSLPNGSRFMIHHDPDFVEGYGALDAIPSVSSDVKLDEARRAISIVVGSPGLVAFSIGENTDALYRSQ
jgi:hypothetical protein